MMKKMKRQPLLFVEVLFWKSRRECHYINAEYLLDELGHLKKESRNWNNTQGDGDVGSSPAKLWTRRSIADALGEDEADVVITHDSGYQNIGEMLDDDIEGFASALGSKNGKDDNSGEQLMEDESGIPPRRKKKLILDGELERQIKDLFEKFKEDRHCSRRIAEVLDPDGKISPAQVSNMLKKLGLKVGLRKKMGDAGEAFSTSPTQLDGDGTAGGTNQKSNSEGSLFVQHLQKRKRIRAFNEDQEAQIRVLYEQFKDHKRCSFMIANALDADGKYTPAQVCRKLKQLGLSLPQKKGSGGKMHLKGENLMNSTEDGMDESDDETLLSLKERRKPENTKLSSEETHEQTRKDNSSKDEFDDEMLSSILEKKMKNKRVSSEQFHEHTGEDTLSRHDSDDEMLSSVLKKTRRSLLKSKHDNLEAIQIEERITDDDSLDGGIKDFSESGKLVGFMTSKQVENQQVDHDLVDSEDEAAVSAFPDNTVTRRKLRMVIDPEDDD